MNEHAALRERDPHTYTTHAPLHVSTNAWTGAEHIGFHSYTHAHSRVYDFMTTRRIIPGFVAQFGMNGDPAVQKVWKSRTIEDDKMGVWSNKQRYAYDAHVHAFA